MKDIETKEDIELLVNNFYSKVMKDKTIGHFFNNIAKVNWSEHLPKMYSFWESLLFGSATYKGNPMATHLLINGIEPLKEHHFQHWLKLWKDTVNELFFGKNADLIIYKASNISQLMSLKMRMAQN